ncbi:heat shock protein 67B3 [Calliphora vicina]|uniref:heat shock protein 67B3 n=1 Tax=Calliphora vicina TaxID=7373 RepID=UPI00325B4D2E
MANLPFVLNFDPHPFYNPDIFPNNVYRRLHTRHHHPIDMHTMGLITALAPHIRQLEANGKSKEDLAHVPIKGLNKDKDHDFAIHIDVGLFEPEELNVKIVNDHLIIEGKHEEREADDIGFVSRHFVRRYELPKGHNPDAIVCKLSSDGVLSVMLPKSNEEPKERIIPIQQTGPNDLFLKNKKENGEKDKTKNGEEKQ